MARCSDNAVRKTVGQSRLSKNDKLVFTLLKDLDTCTCSNTSNFTLVEGAGSDLVYTFNRYSVPADVFSCDADKCRNTGTLTAEVDVEEGDASSLYGQIDFPIRHDATEFYAGVLTFYVYSDKAGTFSVKVELGDITQLGSNSLGNWDSYTQDVTFEEPGFRPVMIDLAQIPNGVVGTGWQADTRGAVVRIDIQVLADLAPATVGVSSICFHDSVEDFETNDTVEITCLSDLTNEITADAVDASCWGSGIDPTSLSIDFSITAMAATGNFWKLNPMEYKGTKTSGYTLVTDQKTVGSITYNGINYGYIQFPEMFMDECGFTGISIADQCNVSDAELTRVYSPVPMNIHERQFQVMDGTFSEELDAGTILVHESLIGLDIVVTYPRQAQGQEYIADDTRLNKRRVRMTYESCTVEDGKKSVFTYDNVLILSFPMSRTVTDEPSWTFTISIQRDNARQAFYRRFEVEPS